MLKSIMNSQTLVRMDRVCDYLPICSTITNATAIFFKCVYLSNASTEKVRQNHYYEYLQKKDFSRCIALLIPGIGNIFIFLKDLSNWAFSRRQFVHKPLANIDHLPMTPNRSYGLVFKNAFNESICISEARWPYEYEADQSTLLEELVYLFYRGRCSGRVAEHQKLALDSRRQDEAEIIEGGRFYQDCSFVDRQESSLRIKYLSHRWDDQFLNQLNKPCIEKLMNEFKVDLLKEHEKEACYKRFGSVGIKRIGYSPVLMTSTIAVNLGKPPNTPNWLVCLNLAKIFFEWIPLLTQNPKIERLLRKDQEIKHKLIELCQLFVLKIKQLGHLHTHIIPLIENFFDKQEKLLLSFHANAALFSEQTKAFYREKQKIAIQSFQWDEWTQLLVAEKKFALHSEIFAKFPEKMLKLQQLMQPAILKENHTLISTVAYRSFKTLSLGFWKIGQSQNAIEEKEFVNDWNHCFQNIQTFEDLLQFSNHSEPLINKKDLNIHKYRLIFDLKQKQIVWMTPPYPKDLSKEYDPSDWRAQHRSKDLSGDLVPLIKMYVVPKLGVFFNHSLSPFCNSEALRQVQNTKGIPNEGYRQSLRTLIDNYKDLLNQLVEGKEIGSTHPLFALSDGEIICSEKPNEIPLIFPKKLIRYLETLLYPSWTLNLLTGHGKMIPFYEFCTEYNLLAIRFELHLQGGDVLQFAKFVIAKFDTITVESFNSKLILGPNFNRTDTNDDNWLIRKCQFNLSEFFIQAMYSSFAKVGLPAKGSLFFPYFQQIAPLELPFIGLYQLWDQRPDQVIGYNSQVVEPTTSNDSFFMEPIQARFLRDLEEIILFLEIKKRKLLMQDEEHKNQYKIVVLLLKLFSKDRLFTDIMEKLETHLQLSFPDQIDILKDPCLFSKPSREKIQQILQDNFSDLNDETIHLMNYLEIFKDIIQWIQNDFKKLKENHDDRFPIDKNHKFNPFEWNKQPVLTVSQEALKEFFSLSNISTKITSLDGTDDLTLIPSRLSHLFQKSQEGVEETNGINNSISNPLVL